jgi:hypothetical protein
MSLRVSVIVVCLWRYAMRCWLYCFTYDRTPRGHLLRRFTKLYAVAVIVLLWCEPVRG